MGMYAVPNKKNIGKPEIDAALQVTVDAALHDETISYKIPVIHKRTDRVRGEVNEPLHIVPVLSIGMENPVYVFKSGEQKLITVGVKAFTDVQDVVVALDVPKDWSVSRNKHEKLSLKKDGNQILQYVVTAPRRQSQGFITATATHNGRSYNQTVTRIDYNHIPDQQLLQPSTASVVNPNLKIMASTIAYINGAGDDVARGIEAMGVKVFRYDPDAVPTDLSKYDAVMVGIRAYNVASESMAALQPRLREYVNDGGNLIMQYNTNRGIGNNELGPLEITLSRKRVTKENAPVRIIAPDHAVVNIPNKITEQDFQGWVQERGLYFPQAWDPAFTPILSMNDAGEEAATGSLIVAPYGKGSIVYTGLSLFRELPAGVPGAYKLLANILSLESAKPINTQDEPAKY